LEEIILFTPGKISLLELPNRLVSSATAERMANNLASTCQL